MWEIQHVGLITILTTLHRGAKQTLLGSHLSTKGGRGAMGEGLRLDKGLQCHQIKI